LSRSQVRPVTRSMPGATQFAPDVLAASCGRLGRRIWIDRRLDLALGAACASTAAAPNIDEMLTMAPRRALDERNRAREARNRRQQGRRRRSPRQPASSSLAPKPEALFTSMSTRPSAAAAPPLCSGDRAPSARSQDAACAPRLTQRSRRASPRAPPPAGAVETAAPDAAKPRAIERPMRFCPPARRHAAVNSKIMPCPYHNAIPPETALPAALPSSCSRHPIGSFCRDIAPLERSHIDPKDISRYMPCLASHHREILSG